MANYVAANGAASTLVGAITASATTLSIQVADVSKFPVVNNGGTGTDYTRLTLQDAANNIEIVNVTRHDAAASSFTIVRGQEGTTARAWNTGDAVACRLTAGVVTDSFVAATSAASSASAAAASASSALSGSANDSTARAAAAAAAPGAHVGSNGAAHGVATASVAGFMSSTDKSKLDGVAAGAQVNAVTSVAGKTGAVSVTAADVGLGSVNNTADSAKSVNYAASAGYANSAGSAPASDVYAWAKAASKPSYSAAEVGLGSVNNTADSAKSVNYAASAGYAGSAGSAPASDVYAWAKQASKPSYSASELGFVTSLASNGYVMLPGGMIMQWGYTTTGSGVVPFNIAFPNGCLNVLTTLKSVGSGGSISHSTNIASFTTTGFTASYFDFASPVFAGTYWFAIGY